jgi:endonuclease YncB( thermonuclease family)
MSFAAALFLCLSPVAVDGDTLRCAGVGMVRLLGIDAPEMPGHCRAGRVCTPGDGRDSKVVLARLIAGQRIVCAPAARDSYGRVLARCDDGAVDLSCAMIASGHAVPRYSVIQCGTRRP